MRESDIVILNGDEALSLLAGRELEIVEVVRKAYEAHARGESMLPHSMFLRFPDEERNRIIALPAYLGDGFSVAGIKWIASFPANLERGMERASAVVILNSTETGRTRAIIEGSAISAKRTAASAALAAQHLHDVEAAQVGIIGCGLIGFELVRFILATLRGVESLLIFDKHVDRAQRFKDKCRELSEKVEVRLAPDAATVLKNCPLTALATTATTPHIQELSQAPPRGTILHVSLRDLAPEVILSTDNVVDDVDHVCRAQTSIHLAEQSNGNRDFIRCTLGDILLGRAGARSRVHGTTIFSPFGLGILDLAVAHFLFEQALRQGVGTVINSFFPVSWTERAEGR
jgi:N-[(2S)-2-amino-2-carboxyethyl]-L-glutamate dehydrogenase